MKLSSAIGVSLILLAVAGLVIYFGYLTLDKADSEEWGFVVLGVIGTVAVFSGFVALVRAIANNIKDGDNK